MKQKLISSIILPCLFIIATTFPVFSEPYLLLETLPDWDNFLTETNPDNPHISPLEPADWDGYMSQWNHPESEKEGDPYPPTTFMPAQLYVWEGPHGPYELDAGLVMAWGDSELPDGDYASAWDLDFGLDPDLSNATIRITVMPPCGINAVSFGIQDIAGNIRSWWWSVPAPIACNQTTTITIDASKTGIAAASPPATGYFNNPAFMITCAQSFIVDENFQWVGGQVPVPPPGQTDPRPWNYWSNLVVVPQTTVNKGYHLKWSQPPVALENGLINGWDEKSLFKVPPMMADDWACKDDRPITDIHWWGSYIGWNQWYPPPVTPIAFHMGIWTDVPAGAATPFSHPGELIWEHVCDTFVWNFAGYDLDPRGVEKNEACFQFNQLLPQEKWFYQEPGPEGLERIYWLSISAIYQDGVEVLYPWGWKTRPHHFNDDAVVISDVAPQWPPEIGDQWAAGYPVEFPEGISWDLAFELTTNLPSPDYHPPVPGDLDGNGKVDLPDAVGILQIITGLRSAEGSE